MRIIGAILSFLAALLLIVVLIPLAGLGYGFMTTSELPAVEAATVEADAAAPGVANSLEAEIPGYQRPEESTFLTYPEWAIVYAAREYAGFVDDRFPSGFPFWSYAGRFWQDYALMIRASRPYPFNFSNHLMLVVIGTSNTIELGIQSIYENTIGRLGEVAAGWQMVPEDRYQADVAAEYAVFLDQVPRYRFAYGEKRAGLWDVESAGGLAAIRSWERKLGFGLAFTVKQGYAALIAGGLSATSDPALTDIYVWAQGPVAEAVQGEADTSVERDLGSDGSVFRTRRYQVFTDMIPRLIERGVRFVLIGGNRRIFLTVLDDGDVTLPAGARLIFAYRLPAEPETTRAGIVVEVGQLHKALPALITSGARLEHVYDY